MSDIRLDSIEPKTIFPGHDARLIHTERMTIAYWLIEAGARAPEHSHHHEQVVNVLAGKYELTVDGEPHELTPGVVFVIPPHVSHSGLAVTGCELLDVFCPVREDYK